uniref:NADH-ubiquinone oxidoreductase chain 3 n=1 Tax=Peltocephalus dumerilianus TaxID=329145 RepID=A0A1Z4EAW6_9SAUR|nr:NADH dehydrogenase subunit 3 [Peltocephalus dumerilianus]
MCTLLLALTITTILMLLNYQLTPQTPTNEKLSPYECGFNPLAPAWLPFSVRFFLVAILFLLFDLEIALLLPLPWAIQLPSPNQSLTWMATILALLTLGFTYEWSQGGLEWPE